MESQCLQEIQPKPWNVSMATYPLFHCQNSSGEVVRDDYVRFESWVDFNFFFLRCGYDWSKRGSPTDRPTNWLTLQLCSSHSYVPITDHMWQSWVEIISQATKKLEEQDQLQPRDKSYLYNITESEAELLEDGFAASVVNPKWFLFRYVSYCEYIYYKCRSTTLHSYSF